MKWVVQTNLGSDGYHKDLKVACEELDHEFVGIEAVPFSDELPDISVDEPTIFYGATNLVTQIHRSGKWTPGVFFHEEHFKMTTAMAEIPGAYWLNSGSPIWRLDRYVETLSGSFVSDDNLVFIRPDKDLKEFAGEVMSVGEIKSWFKTIEDGKTLIDPRCRVLIGMPYNIEREWRLFIVDKKVVAASQYRESGKLSQAEGAPKDVVDTAEIITKIWTPAKVCVMDLCLCGGNVYIVEFNCFNSSGFYHANIKDIVREVSNLE